MNPCLIRVSADYPKGAKVEMQGEWLKKIRSKGYMGYELSTLSELPDTLRGAQQYAFDK